MRRDFFTARVIAVILLSISMNTCLANGDAKTLLRAPSDLRAKFARIETAVAYLAVFPPPTSQPSKSPSNSTSQPSGQPSKSPASQPTNQPISQPSRRPTLNPSHNPSGTPTSQPSANPSSQPTGNPTTKPSDAPALNIVSTSSKTRPQRMGADAIAGMVIGLVLSLTIIGGLVFQFALRKSYNPLRSKLPLSSQNAGEDRIVF